MKIPYIKIPITDMYAYLSPLPAQNKGQILEAILYYGMYQQWPSLTLTPQQEQAYCIVQEMIEREIKSYKKFCKEQKQKIKKYWAENKNTDDTNVLPPCQNQAKQKQETKTDTENINTSTAPTQPAQEESLFKLPKKLPNKTKLQQFSNQVLEQFESTVQTREQKGIWFRRNCRCLSDILGFCNQDITLALQTIRVCILRLKKAGFSGGYEAVCRNLPEYAAQAQKELEGEYGFTQ